MVLWRNYAAAFIQLALAEARRGRGAAALETLRVMEQRLPPARLGMTEEQRASIWAGVRAAIPAEAAPPGG
jgi:hypothetical protein